MTTVGKFSELNPSTSYTNQREDFQETVITTHFSIASTEEYCLEFLMWCYKRERKKVISLWKKITGENSSFILDNRVASLNLALVSFGKKRLVMFGLILADWSIFHFPWSCSQPHPFDERYNCFVSAHLPTSKFLGLGNNYKQDGMPSWLSKENLEMSSSVLSKAWNLSVFLLWLLLRLCLWKKYSPVFSYFL